MNMCSQEAFLCRFMCSYKGHTFSESKPDILSPFSFVILLLSNDRSLILPLLHSSFLSLYFFPLCLSYRFIFSFFVFSYVLSILPTTSILHNLTQSFVFLLLHLFFLCLSPYIISSLCVIRAYLYSLMLNSQLISFHSLSFVTWRVHLDSPEFHWFSVPFPEISSTFFPPAVPVPAPVML